MGEYRTVSTQVPLLGLLILLFLVLLVFMAVSLVSLGMGKLLASFSSLDLFQSTLISLGSIGVTILAGNGISRHTIIDSMKCSLVNAIVDGDSGEDDEYGDDESDDFFEVPSNLKHLKGTTTAKNAPCHCGSGLKYKRCCYNKEKNHFE